MGSLGRVKFKLGLALGFIAGYWAGSRSDEQRKREVDEAVRRVREDPRVQRVGETVSQRAARLGDAVEHRLVGGADGAAASPSATEPETGPSG